MKEDLLHAVPPLILTIALNSDAQDHFNRLRTQHFPAYCNYLQAHLTLFHNLPSDDSMIDDVLSASSLRQTFNLEVSGVKNIGSGVAFTIQSEPLLQLHRSLQKAFDKFLINQDRQKLWPHITVQNKVTGFKAQQTTETLQLHFQPFTIKAVGIESWLYLKGPWQHHRTYPFNKEG